MRIRKTFLPWLLAMGLLLLTGHQTIQAAEAEHRFSFAALADPRDKSDAWKNALGEIRHRNAHPEPEWAPVEMIVVAGDMDPLKSRYKDYQHLFANEKTRPIFLPVIGNHEFDYFGAHFRRARDVLIPSIPGVARRHAASCDYYLDHKNVRIIVVDGYSDLGKRGVINDKGRQ